MRAHFIILLWLITWTGCVEPYEFTVTDTVETLVVDAVFTNELKAHEVKLSLSGALDSDEVIPVTNATVWIIEGAGGRIDLTESEPGIYATEPTVQGNPGVSYTLYVRLANGDEYASSTAPLPASVALDSIYGRFIELPSTENDQILKGVQFFVDTHDDSSESSNFRYEYTEDYEIIVPYPSLFEWDDLTQTFFPRSIDVGTCYGQEEFLGLTIATTNGQSQNRLAEFPLRLIGPDGGQLSSRYSISVKQHSISSTAYQYYKTLKENNESSGSFFDRQKGTIPGNMVSTTTTERPVLGYFELSGVSTAQAFFTPDDFKDQGFAAISPFRFQCAYGSAADSVEVTLLTSKTMSGRNIFNFTFPVPDEAILITEACSDCRLHGDINKPDFWD